MARTRAIRRQQTGSARVISRGSNLLPHRRLFIAFQQLGSDVCSHVLINQSGIQGDVLMCKFLLTLISLAALSPFATAAPGAVRCGQLLDVHTGKLLKDQVIVFDADGTITAVGPAGSPLAAGGATTVDL